MNPILTRSFDSAAQEAYLSLWRTYDRLRAIEDRLFEHWGLTAQQYNVLRILLAADPKAVATLTIASKLISKAPDITRMLDRLESRGHVQRERSTSDRRAVMVRLTPAGKELLAKIQPELDQCHEEQLGHMDAEELEALTTLLRKAREPHESGDSAWS